LSETTKYNNQIKQKSESTITMT